MGLMKAAKDAVSTMMSDQWREYFYCDTLSNDILAVKGQKKVTDGRNSNRKGIDNIISNGSIIAVNEGQCMLIVEQGEIVEFCGDAGEFVYDASTEPSLFYGSLGESVAGTFRNIGRRFSFGGSTARDQRIYYINTKEIMSNLFGTATPIPFRVIDENIALDMEAGLRCNGQYSFKITDPLIFYKNICGNVTDDYNRSELQGQMKSELITALQPAFARLSGMGIRYSALAAHSMEISRALREELSSLWGELRGIEVVTVSINSATLSEKDAEYITSLQKEAAYSSDKMARAMWNKARAEALVGASQNDGGAFVGFMGMNMADAMGRTMDMTQQNQGGERFAGPGGMMGAAAAVGAGFGMNANQAAGAMPGMNEGQGAAGMAGGQVQQAPVLGWSCSCGQTDNRGKFCSNCGQKKPEEAGWTCSCGTVNKGKFCMECGQKRPEGAPIYKCDKCGWEPEDPAHPPKFCPECGDSFDENDRN